MPDKDFSTQFRIWKNLQDRAAPALILTYQLIVLVGLAAIPLAAYFQASNWINSSGIIPRSDLSALQENYLRLISETHTTAGLSALAYLWIPYIVGWIYLGSSLWVYHLRRNDPAGRAFAIFSSAAAFSISGLVDQYLGQSLNWLWYFSIPLVGGALINLALVFPVENHQPRALPYLRWFSYLAVIPLTFATLLFPNQVTIFGITLTPLGFSLVYTGIGLLVIFITTLYWRMTSASPLIREQSRIFLVGFILSLIPLVSALIISIIQPGTKLSPLLLAPLGILPITSGFAIIRFRSQNSDDLLARVATYAVLTGLVALSYALIVAGASMIAGQTLPAAHPVFIALLVLFLAIALNPLRSWLQNRVDAALFRGKSVYQVKIQEFTRELTQTLVIEDILNKLRLYVQQAILPQPCHIFVYDPLRNQYYAAADHLGQITTDLVFSPGSGLVQALTAHGSAIFLAELSSNTERLHPESNRINLLEAQLFVPMPGQKQLVGWLALGPRQAGEPYTSRDISFLESLCDQAALAIERSQVISNLERRVREMDVLSRIAQGINITLEFDDILELIYAQTNLVIPLEDFRVTLYNTSRDSFYNAFYVEKDERISAQEGIPIQIGQGLETIVIRSQKAITTEDYERECRRRGVIPNANSIHAWVSVPLNAGATTIGAISLGSRDPTAVFSEQQIDLIQAIADHAAGAIVKANLLAETEKRARELATLNEITRGLTSTLEVKPLLASILNNATQIITCEAGSLLLLDENTDELVFEVTAGPVAENLVGKRLQPGVGLVGKVVELNQPMITNNAKDSHHWSKVEDQQTGFITRDILAAPMIVKGKTIGVIEVINKQDGSPFSQSDLELLSTFSSQAAIAIENARLYTQTDDALNARLAEMSVMQRIDRELNASLDVERTMRLALDWSIGETHSDAGIIGFIDDGDVAPFLRVIAAKGYSPTAHPIQAAEKTDGGKNGFERIELPIVSQAIKGGKPQRNTHPSKTVELGMSSNPDTYIPDIMSQVAIPIRRKSDVIGMVVLESKRAENYSDESLTFLTRLCDHAAIAISNGLLFADLQTANIAKSEFVSLVSHELKTPMTSIRGYTDLLAQGTVGPINEIQSNFLNTIRSNVNRMANLVSDLADVSRIEAGRIRLEFGEVTIANVVTEVSTSVQAQLETKEHGLDLSIPDDLPPVWGDYNRLIQIMNNLVSNAIKYTPQTGHITIQAVESDNLWDDHGAPKVVHITIQDDGYGISIEDQEKIFQKFFRSGDQSVRDQPGTGLGLNITRHLVEMQGGKIWFESNYGKGSTFHITIPVAVIV